jgi:hypothetical protein
MVYDNLPRLLPTLGKCRIHFKDKGTHWANSIITYDRVIIKMIVGRRDLQFNVGSEPWWGPGILHFSKVLSLTVVKTSVCVQKNIHRDLTRNGTKTPQMRDQCLDPKHQVPAFFYAKN